MKNGLFKTLRRATTLVLGLLLILTCFPIASFASEGGRTNTVYVEVILDCDEEGNYPIVGANVKLESKYGPMLKWFKWISEERITDEKGETQFDVSIGLPKATLTLPAEYVDHVTLDKGVWDIDGVITDRSGEADFEENIVQTAYIAGFEKMYLKLFVNAKIYDVSFNSDGGDVNPDTQKVHFTRTAKEPAAPAKEGFDFGGWYLDGAKYDFSTPVSENIELKAMWTAKPVVKPEDTTTTTTTTSNDDSYSAYNPDEVVINDNETPLAKLNYEDNYAYLEGTDTGMINAESLVTREQAAAIFFRLLDSNSREKMRSYDNSFIDVPKAVWSNKHISTLAKGGIIIGFGDGKYLPRKPITRAELATLVSKFDKLEMGVAHNFTDIKGHWAEKYIASAAKKGWVAGYTDNTFRPNNNITKAELVSFVNRVLGRSVKAAEAPEGMKTFADLTPGQWYYEDMLAATNSYKSEKAEDGHQIWKLMIPSGMEM